MIALAGFSMADAESYLTQYGYTIIFLALFLGIVGIPAPEESFLFFVGMMATRNQLSLPFSFLSAFAGALAGMLAAYSISRFIGKPFIRKFGRFVGLRDRRLNLFERRFNRHAERTVFAGFFLPGLRQASPYFSGIFRVNSKRFLLFSLLGAFTWTALYVGLGVLSASFFPIDPNYIPYIGTVLLGLFILQLLYSLMKRRMSKHRGGSPS